MKIYRITWKLFSKYDTERTKHCGPPLMKIDEDTLRKRPFTLEEATELCKRVNRFATRGHHKVEEYLEVMEELNSDD